MDFVAVEGDVVIVQGGKVLLGGRPVVRATLSKDGGLGIWRDRKSDGFLGSISHEDGMNWCLMRDNVNNGPYLHGAYEKDLYEVTLVLIGRQNPADVAADRNYDAFYYLQKLGADVTNYRGVDFAEGFGSAEISFAGIDHALLVKELPVLSTEVFRKQVLGSVEASGCIGKMMLVNFIASGELMKPRYRERLAKLSRFAPQTAKLCELLATKGHWAVQLRTKVKESTSSHPAHIDHEVRHKTTFNARFELDEPGVT